jgi:hypothetical protein
VTGLTVATLAVFCVLYWVQAIHTGSRLYLATDDVFTLWMIKTPSLMSALKAGADTAPLLFDCLYIVSTFFLLRKHVGDAIAGSAVIISLLGNAGATDLSARPPSIMMMSFSLICLLWAEDSSVRPKRWRSALLACVIAFSISMHYYSVVFVPILLLMELAWSTKYRRIRAAHWIGIVAGACVFPLMLLVILPVYRGTQSSALSAGYYAHPVPSKIIMFVINIAFQKYQVTVLMVLLVLAGLYYWLQMLLQKPDRPRQSGFVSLGIIGFAAGFLPIVIYVFGALVTHAYNERYIVSCALGLAIGFAFLVRSLRWPKELELLLLIFVVAIFGKVVQEAYRFAAPEQVWYESLIMRAPGNEPIALPDGGSFYETQGSSSPLVRSRTVYLFLPAGIIDPDPEPARIAHAWKTLRPELPIYDNDSFIAQHKSFYILTFESPGQALTTWARAHFHTQIVSGQGGCFLIHVSRD